MPAWSRTARLVALLCLVTACAVVTGATSAAPAAAAPGIQFGLTDDAWLTDGPGTLEARLTQLQTLGVQIVRYTLDWNAIAKTRPANAADPNDPAYNWSTVDPVIDGLRSHGIGVLLQLLDTPSWANGGNPSNYAPTSGSSFAAFAHAAALRYPWVKRWLIWNEPNQARWLKPTTPAIYVTRLLNPAYAAIHGVIPGAQVGGGATAPRGVTNGVSPVAWIAGMHAAHARLDAYAHNPYPLDPKRETPLTGGCSYCETITMATVKRLETLVARDFGSARIWLTEYGYQTNPPDKLLGVSQSLQARYVGEGDYQAYRTARVDMLIQYLYRDEPDVARFQSGLVTLGNKHKLSYAAFQLPLAETGRTGTLVTLWGQLRAPAATATARLLRKSGTKWKTLAVLHATPAGYVSWHGRLAVGTWVRMTSGTLTSAQIAVH